MTDTIPPGVLLAGGLSRRMGGGDKCLRDAGGATLLARVIECMRPQAAPLLLNANGDAARFAAYGLPVAADSVEGYAGPLAGILTGLEWAAAACPEARWLASVPTDTPLLPPDLVLRLRRAAEADNADIACAASGGTLHPVIGLWPPRLAGDLRRALAAGTRGVRAWTSGYRVAVVEWPDDPFVNVNTPEDLAALARPSDDR
jgi:molybdopterin-guanine dinucleotide biosynthesis protein A